ncbi:hypothetical protein C7C46_09675 [Streptomyces tateyamensis]|uniref:Uncharacterized protein n=1 Tax=Streptomyces tateyamensis TaxID=565073 RepID=A0A2V4NCU2_9ACTN|nr:hypothetical protein [Streptomyces tateyamensis]PYC82621.1 hypothetical protein C7C46_09675 [Streptomyces tateyamensis]
MSQNLGQWVQWVGLMLGTVIALVTLVRSAVNGLTGRRDASPVLGLLASAFVAGFPLLLAKVLPAVWDSAGSRQAEPVEADHGFEVPWGVVGWVAVGVAAVAGAVVVTLAARRRRAAGRAAQLRRQRIEDRHDLVLEQYGAFCSDILAVLERPLLTDVSVRETAELVHALAAASDARAAGAEGGAEYGRAVTALEIAWQVADRHARKVGTGRLPERERAAVAQAQRLLRTALGEGASDAERQTAYRRAVGLLEGVVVIPREATAEIEGGARHRVLLKSYPEPAGAGSSDAVPR